MRERLLEPASSVYECVRPKPGSALLAQHGSAAADLSPQIWARLTLESWLSRRRLGERRKCDRERRIPRPMGTWRGLGMTEQRR